MALTGDFRETVASLTPRTEASAAPLTPSLSTEVR
jgi:hypothetical protein